MPKQTVVVLGASDKPARYSYRAITYLLVNGHRVIPVNPKLDMIEGLPVIHSLGEINERVDTVTMYVSPAISSAQKEALIQLKPGRVIFNPGSENPELIAALEKHGIETEEACTLVLLSTNQF